MPQKNYYPIGDRIANEVLMFFRSQKKAAQDVSLDEPIDTDKDGNALTIMDTMAGDDTIIDELDLRMKSEKLYTVINKVLDEREKKIIILRYGLYDRKPLAQREVAKLMNISRSYVSRLETTAVSKLRKEMGRG